MRGSSIARLVGAALALVCAIGAPAAAQPFPSKPVRVMIAFGPGTVTDVLVRLIGEKMTPALGQPILVENRGGAGGALAATAVARSPADGHTLLAHTLSGLAFGVVGGGTDPLADFAGVAPLANLTTVIVGAKGKGFDTLREMIALGKAQPGFLNYASTGQGSPSHLYAEKLKVAAGFEATNVAYRGVAEAISDLVAGRVHFFAISLATALPLIREDRVVPLAITSAKRPSFPLDIPTTAEAGVPDAASETGIGLWAPKATPADVIERLNREVRSALQEPDVKSRLAAAGGEPWLMSGAELDRMTERETGEMKAAAARLGLKAAQ